MRAARGAPGVGHGGWRRAGQGACLLLATSCTRPAPVPPPTASARYTVGAPWEAAGVWHYPAERFALTETGLATVTAAHGPLTADGERYDAAVPAAAHATLQLPAAVRVTNLANGRSMLLRVNDRGPADPGRVLALTPRAAALLGIADGAAAPVRLEEDSALSRQLAEALGGGPHLAITAAPREAVMAEALPPPGSPDARPGAARRIGPAPDDAAPAAAPPIPDSVTQAPVEGGSLWLRTDTFGRQDYARRQAALLSGLGPEVQRLREGRTERFAVRAGPFPDARAADAALRRALDAGVTDARIVVE